MMAQSLYCLCILPAVECPVLDIKNSVLLSNNTGYGMTTSVSCEPGYTLPHGVENINFTCGANKTWYTDSNMFAQCQGILVFVIP